MFSPTTTSRTRKKARRINSFTNQRDDYVCSLIFTQKKKQAKSCAWIWARGRTELKEEERGEPR